MNSIFSGSGVFSNSVDYFCLVCDSGLRDENDANVHIGKPVHAKKLDLTDYFENKDNCVRKIKKWYFCELCNLLLKTAARVRLHVVEAKHLENKCSKVLQRRGNFIIAFSKILIGDNAWNGIIDDTCVICNTEFDEENIHKNETTHIIKLIQTSVEFDTNKNLFRKVDETSFHCLTCNMVVALSSIDIHFNDTEHKKLYQNKSDSEKITTLETIEIPEVDTKNQKEEKLECEQVKEAPDTAVKNDNSVKQVNDVVEKSTVNIMNPPQLIDDTIYCKILGAKDYVTTNDEGKSWCILCNWPLDLFVIGDHIKDFHHQTMLELHKERISKLNAIRSSTEISKDVRTKDVKTKNVKTKDVKTKDVKTKDIRIKYVKTTNLKTEDVKTKNVKTKDVKIKDLKTGDIKTGDVKTQHLKAKNTITEDVETDDVKKEDIETKDVITENVKSEDDLSTTILDNVVKYQINNININFEFQSAVCKKCSKVLDFKMQAIEDHIQEHTEKDEQKDAHKSLQLISGLEVKETKTKEATDKKTSLHTTPVPKNKSNEQDLKENCAEVTNDKDSLPAEFESEEEIESFVKENNMSYSSGKKVLCNRCNTYLPTSLKNLKKHILGVSHQRKLNENDTQVAQAVPRSKQADLPKIHTNSFINSVITMDGFYKDILINKILCINLFSFVFMVPNDKSLRCLVCETNIHLNQLKKHMELFKHEIFIDKCLLVVVNNNEFIREIRPGCFHCGFCNLPNSSWDAMEAHLQSNSHRENKNSAEWRLQQYMPLVTQSQLERDVQEQFTMQTMLGRMFGDEYEQ